MMRMQLDPSSQDSAVALVYVEPRGLIPHAKAKAVSIFCRCVS
jgi:hypothetical protein